MRTWRSVIPVVVQRLRQLRDFQMTDQDGFFRARVIDLAFAIERKTHIENTDDILMRISETISRHRDRLVATRSRAGHRVTPNFAVFPVADRIVSSTLNGPDILRARV